MNKPIILLTMGDPCGIGPELCVKASQDVLKLCTPVIVGDPAVLFAVNPKVSFHEINDIKEIQDNKINVFGVLLDEKFESGKPSARSGLASFMYLEKGYDFIKAGLTDRLVTAPISKFAWQNAGIKFSGHTEALASMSGRKKFAMLFVNDKVRTVLATRHIPVKDIAMSLDERVLNDSIDASIEFLESIGVKHKRIGVCGLNPHAGDKGYIGREEIEVIMPALDKYRREDIVFIGPESSDAVFHKAMLGELDIVIAMYHDQGILPMKVISYYDCVNITWGLPFVRTSPGHGTAFDIAGKNISDPSSMISAIRWAVKIGVDL